MPLGEPSHLSQTPLYVLSTTPIASVSSLPWLLNNPQVSATGELRDTARLLPFLQLRLRNASDQLLRDLSLDDEAFDAVTNYFWGQENGIVLEMGALDGNQYSVSKEFIPLLWHRVLIEATPLWHKQALRVSADATYVGAAVCPKGTRVHYLSRPSTDSAINGIAEFMTPNFMKEMHPTIHRLATKDGSEEYSLVNVDWANPLLNEELVSAESIHLDQTFAQSISCVEVNDVLGVINVRHVNFFVLDVEGGELEVLRSIDFSRLRFDIICVETDATFRPQGYGAAVAAFLSANHYKFLADRGRNAWFQHRDFTPKRRFS